MCLLRGETRSSTIVPPCTFSSFVFLDISWTWANNLSWQPGVLSRHRAFQRMIERSKHPPSKVCPSINWRSTWPARRRPRQKKGDNSLKLLLRSTDCRGHHLVWNDSSRMRVNSLLNIFHSSQQTCYSVIQVQ